MKHAYLLVLLGVGVILVSGCTIPGLPTGTTTSGNGIVIDSFGPDFQQIYSTESVQLSLKIRNAGSVDGVIKDVRLTGVDWIGNSLGMQNTCDGLKNKKLLAAVPAQGTTGATGTCVWQVSPKTSEVPNGLSVTFYPIARVTYHYSTTTTKAITFGTTDEMRNIQNSGGSLPAGTVSTTSSPVTIDITSNSPIRVSSAGVEFPIQIKVTNSAGGIVCSDCSSGDSANWNKMKLNIQLPKGLTVVEGCEDGKEISLWRGQDNTIGCKLSISADAISGGSIQKTITVTASYDYITDSTTSVTITGQTPSQAI